VPDGAAFLRGADPRLTPARADLAAEHLKGTVDSAQFVPATRMQVKAAIIPLRPVPKPDAGIDTVLLYGEGFDVYDMSEDWAWGQATRDGYVGYIPRAALSADMNAATHTVAVPTTHLYPKADIKTEPVAALWMTSLWADITCPPNTSFRSTIPPRIGSPLLKHFCMFPMSGVEKRQQVLIVQG